MRETAPHPSSIAMPQPDPAPFLSEDDLWVEILWGCSPERASREEKILQQGFPLPLPHRTFWAESREPDRSWFVAILDETGKPIAGFAIEASPTRALPGHVILRAERWGNGLTPRQAALGLRAIHKLAKVLPRVLRVHVEHFSLDPATREQLTEQFQASGFRRLKESRGYSHTLLIDLTPSGDEIFASFHRTARRHVRAVAKNPVELRTIDNVTCTPRMEQLYRETMARTGGEVPGADWSKIIRLSAEHPEALRLVGLFRTDEGRPDSLLAFAWGCGHGDHAHYDAAASTRRTDLKLPLGYGLVWDLVQWAKQTGCQWFDFGGVTEGEHGGQDPLGGISDFKRYFSKTVIQVHEEWILEPRPIRAKLASVISSGMNWVRGLRRAVSRTGSDNDTRTE